MIIMILSLSEVSSLVKSTDEKSTPVKSICHESILASVFVISSYGAPLAQRTSYLALHSFLSGPDGAVNYDYIITNSINCLLIGSKCLPNGAHTNHC